MNFNASKLRCEFNYLIIKAIGGMCRFQYILYLIRNVKKFNYIETKEKNKFVYNAYLLSLLGIRN